MIGVVLLEDLVDLSQGIVALLVVLMIILIILPVVIPITLVFFSGARASEEQESLISNETEPESTSSTRPVQSEVIFSELEDEKSSDIDMLPEAERRRRMAQLQTKLFQAAAEGAVRVKRRTGPHRGEDFTLMQALVKADFWLLFLSLVLASGSGLTIVDNMGQISESLGYSNTDIFVSMISIWCFLGRVGGGYLSELIVRNYAYPRPVAMSVVELIMALGLFFYAMAWPGAIYVLTVVIGLGYGALWAIVPAAASELFGLKSFAAYMTTRQKNNLDCSGGRPPNHPLPVPAMFVTP
uniref:NFD4 C-terminal domain-containing protein n=1 Tax=Kalanchoe fedtschenkoi TaxID=63787 RepID=A0A7N0UH63_KALFE